jgi:hypothetical protein
MLLTPDRGWHWREIDKFLSCLDHHDCLFRVSHGFFS